MQEPRSTDRIRMIAQDVTSRQLEVCTARRDNLDAQMDGLTKMVTGLADVARQNTASIAALSATVAVMASTIAPLAGDVKTNKDDIKRMLMRPVWATAIGSVVQGILVVLLWWFSINK